MHDPDTPPLMLGLFFVALQSHWGKHTAYKATNAAKNNKNETACNNTTGNKTTPDILYLIAFSIV